MEEGLKNKVLHWFTFAVLSVVVIGGLVSVYPSYKRAQALKLQDAEWKARIEAKKAEIAKLKENQRRFKTDSDFVETIARRNSRIYPGELVYIFDEK